MVRIPTNWTTNSTKNADAVQYSSASVQYSSASVRYTSSTVNEDELDKPATLWTTIAKTPSSWTHNLAYYTNEYVFDSATITFDSATRTFDGINGSQQSTNTGPRTAWTVVS